MEVILHIGPHKTGTTALQSHLSAAGLVDACYPVGGRLSPDGTLALGHHPLARLLRSKHTPRSELESIASAIRAESSDAAVVILSSEAFMLAGPEAIARTRWFLDRLRPERIRVIAYLRESLSHSASLFQDKVHTYTEEYSFPDFLRRSRELDLGTLRGLWSPVGRLILRPYDRSLFTGGDITSDFGATIGVALGAVRAGSRDPNPSIGGNLLVVKAILNNVGIGDRAARLPLRRLAREDARFRGRFRIPPGFSRDFRAASQLNHELVLLFPDLPMRDLSADPMVPDAATFEADVALIADRMSLMEEEVRAVMSAADRVGPWFLNDIA
ncbi:MAG: hypothetical protein RLZZ272_197 [Actinomycetota bacterium]|jgi:hypothetical protein